MTKVVVPLSKIALIKKGFVGINRQGLGRASLSASCEHVDKIKNLQGAYSPE
jgi:hypothetical protein